MANTTKRKSPAKRKPAKKRPSGLALSGWLVAAGLGVALIGPQAARWWDHVVVKLPSVDELRAMAHRPESRPPMDGDAREQKVASRAEDSAPNRSPQKKPPLPPVKSEGIAEIARKSAIHSVIPLSATRLKAPTIRDGVADGPSSALTPPVPSAPIPLMKAAIRQESQARPPIVRPGELAIRRYPFTTAPAVAYVSDLRKIRILGGEGDWKKVEVSGAGVVGWLRLQRLGAGSGERTTEASNLPRPPVPGGAARFREADAPGPR